jgi:hypothetical protein
VTPDRVASDRLGRPVNVGTKVRVLEVGRALKQGLPLDEWHELETMIGEVFEVFEVDEYGSAWVEKLWRDGDGLSRSQTLALRAHELEVV